MPRKRNQRVNNRRKQSANSVLLALRSQARSAAKLQSPQLQARVEKLVSDQPKPGSPPAKHKVWWEKFLGLLPAVARTLPSLFKRLTPILSRVGVSAEMAELIGDAAGGIATLAEFVPLLL